MLQHLKCGREVAILPRLDSSPAETIELAILKFVGNVVVQLSDGRIYRTNNGQAFSFGSDGYAVPATDEHRAAILESRQSLMEFTRTTERSVVVQLDRAERSIAKSTVLSPGYAAGELLIAV